MVLNTNFLYDKNNEGKQRMCRYWIIGNENRPFVMTVPSTICLDDWDETHNIFNPTQPYPLNNYEDYRNFLHWRDSQLNYKVIKRVSDR